MLLIEVKQAAKFLGVSDRRVRALLEQGRMVGFKDKTVWKVYWPIDIRPGKRGPDMTRYPVRSSFKPKKS